jgi:hypothetical protein
MKEFLISIPDVQLKKAVEEINIDYAAFFEKSKIDLNKKYDRPPTAISIGQSYYKGEFYPQRFATFGNLSVIAGDKKSRKTFFKSMLLGCSIGGKANKHNSDIKGHNLDDKWIIDIDTEQDEYDNWVTAKRIPEMVGSLPKNYISVNLRGSTPNEIKGFLDWLFTKSEYRTKIGIVAIDGYVDCVNSFNDEVECREFVTTLMKYTKMTNCHITGILHLNPNSEKSRGHLGTIIEQKCQMVVITKDMGDYSEVICKSARGVKRFDTFYINVNDEDWLPYTLNQNEIDYSIVDKTKKNKVGF